jgi:hypothetical protein
MQVINVPNWGLQRYGEYPLHSMTSSRGTACPTAAERGIGGKIEALSVSNRTSTTDRKGRVGNGPAFLF